MCQAFFESLFVSIQGQSRMTFGEDSVEFLSQGCAIYSSLFVALQIDGDIEIPLAHTREFLL